METGKNRSKYIEQWKIAVKNSEPEKAKVENPAAHSTLVELMKKQNQMIEKINSVGDIFDQYSFLIMKSSYLPGIPEEERKDDDLVAGCQSKVWLMVTVDQNGIFSMRSESDTLIIRGILELFEELLNGEKADAVARLDIQLLAKTELAATFTSDRTTGMKKIMEKIQALAGGNNN